MSDSNRGMNPTPANPQQVPWGGQERPTLDPAAVNSAATVINNPAVAQPSAAMQSISAMIGKR